MSNQHQNLPIHYKLYKWHFLLKCFSLFIGTEKNEKLNIFYINTFISIVLNFICIYVSSKYINSNNTSDILALAGVVVVINTLVISKLNNITEEVYPNIVKYIRLQDILYRNSLFTIGEHKRSELNNLSIAANIQFRLKNHTTDIDAAHQDLLNFMQDEISNLVQIGKTENSNKLLNPITTNQLMEIIKKDNKDLDKFFMDSGDGTEESCEGS